MSNKQNPVQFDFSGKAVVVTGGSRGIGAGIARGFAQAGASVVVNYRTGATEAEQVVAEIRQAGGEATAVSADVTQKQDVARLVEQTVGEYGRIDIWINNAGSYPLDPLTDMSEAAWDDVISSNLRSVFLGTQAAANQMIQQGDGGAIINIASIEAENPAPLHSHYTSAKAGVIMHTKTAANELGQHNIRVNAVSPGLIWRDGIDEQWPEGVDRWQKAAPLTRLGQPADVANACLFLASPAASWITGINLRVDGGVMTNQIF